MRDLLFGWSRCDGRWKPPRRYGLVFKRRRHLDPAGYKDNPSQQDELFPMDWVATQRDLGLDVIRSEGKFARRNNQPSLREAFAGRLPAGVSRVVSLADSWLHPGNVGPVIEAVRNCDDPLTFVLAACFDPLESVGAVHSLRAVLDAAAVFRELSPWAWCTTGPC